MGKARYPFGSESRAEALLVWFFVPALLLQLNCDNANPLFPSPSPALGVVPSGITILDFPLDISPDGRHFVYGHLDPNSQTAGIYLGAIPPDSTTRFLMPLGASLSDPRGLRFSPDSRKIALIRGDLLATRMYVYDLETGQETPMSPAQYTADSPDWDPSGQYLVYDRPWLSPGDPDSVAGIHFIDLESVEDRSLRHGGTPTPGGDPRWSPDSSWICFSYGTRLGTGDRPPMAIHIYRVRPDGTGYADLMPGLALDHHSANWINGGSELLFEVYDPKLSTGHQTVVTRSDGSNRRFWPLDILWGAGVVISRDGSQVVFMGEDPSGKYGILYVQGSADVAGKSRVQLTFAPEFPHHYPRGPCRTFLRSWRWPSRGYGPSRQVPWAKRWESGGIRKAVGKEPNLPIALNEAPRERIRLAVLGH